MEPLSVFLGGRVSAEARASTPHLRASRREWVRQARRYEAALETFLLGVPTLPHGEPHDCFHDLALGRDFDGYHRKVPPGYHEAMLGHDFEDESAGGSPVRGATMRMTTFPAFLVSSDDAACLADSALA